ncbi:MAG: hypothetical protein Q8P11_04275 [bacterium]|nr:hypothetical protein [bacterium]
MTEKEKDSSEVKRGRFNINAHKTQKVTGIDKTPETQVDAPSEDPKIDNEIDKVRSDIIDLYKQNTLFRKIIIFCCIIFLAICVFGWWTYSSMTQERQQTIAAMEETHNKLVDKYNALVNKYADDSSVEAYNSMTAERDQAITSLFEKDATIAELTAKLEEANPAEEVKEDAKPAEEVKEDAKPAEEVKEDAKPAEDVKEDAKPAEDVKEDAKPAEETPVVAVPKVQSVVKKNNPPKVIPQKKVQQKKPVAVQKKPVRAKPAVPAPKKKRPNIMDLL